MKINVEITGITPLLMNRFTDDTLETKVRDKNTTPREEAAKTAYLDKSGKLYYPTANIYACIVNAGKFHKNGKSKITTVKSSIIPAGLMIEGNIIHFDKPDHWEVDSRHCVLPTNGAAIMRHRCRLDTWSLTFVLELDTTMFSPKLIRQIVDDAGSKCGLGCFRPERKGFYGKFVVTKWKEEIVKLQK